jgi:FkbM family methyltransferase
LKTRNGESIDFDVCGPDGKWRSIQSGEEFGFLVNLFWNVKSSAPFIAKRCIMKLDAAPLAAFAMLAVKKGLGREVNRERELLFRKLEGITRVRISFRGKTVQLPCVARTFGLLYQTFVMNQYDVSEENVEGKVVVDVGANIGDFSFFCAFFSPKRVYAFEPMSHTFEVLRASVDENGLEGIIIPVKKGLGEKAEIVPMQAGDDAVIGKESRAGQEESIEIVSLDEYLSGAEIGFLKMDVEGYEENVLLRAKKTIRQWKPVLSFSAYHKPTDKVRLPEVVKSIREDYSIRLNRHFEEDFYCE